MGWRNITHSPVSSAKGERRTSPSSPPCFLSQNSLPRRRAIVLPSTKPQLMREKCIVKDSRVHDMTKGAPGPAVRGLEERLFEERVVNHGLWRRSFS